MQKKKVKQETVGSPLLAGSTHAVAFSSGGDELYKIRILYSTVSPGASFEGPDDRRGMTKKKLFAGISKDNSFSP